MYYMLCLLIIWAGFVESLEQRYGTASKGSYVHFVLLEAIVTEEGRPQLECKWMLWLRAGAFSGGERENRETSRGL